MRTVSFARKRPMENSTATLALYLYTPFAEQMFISVHKGYIFLDILPICLSLCAFTQFRRHFHYCKLCTYST